MLFFFSLVMISVTAMKCVPDNSLIDWNTDRKLNWEDFKAAPDKNSPNAALTSTAIKIDFTYNNQALKFHIRCQFDKKSSWGRVKNDYILSHEQGHFDIAEIFARRLYKSLKEYEPNPETLTKDINKIYQDMMQQYHDRQTLYDGETKFSIDTEKQAEWLKKIKNELVELKAYSDYH